MIIVHVTYTIQSAFAETNRANIARFLEDFKQLDNTAFRYTVLVAADGKTFTHTSVYANAEIQQELLHVPSFLEFQRQRDASGLESEPRVEFLEAVGMSSPVF